MSEPQGAEAVANTERQLAALLCLLQERLATPGTVAGVVAPRPFQFESLDHLNERVLKIMTRVASIEHLQPSTIRSFRDAYRSLVRFVAQEQCERDLLAGDLERQKDVLIRWRGWLLDQRLSRVTVRTYWRSLASLLRRIEEQDKMLNPLRWLPAPKSGRLLPRALSKDTARRVVLFVRNYRWDGPLAHSRNTAIVLTMLLAGLRRSELTSLRCEDVDLIAGTIRIRRGKGANGGKQRTAYMPPQLRDSIVEYARDRARIRPLRSVPEFFTALHANAPIGGSALRRLFTIVARETGIHVTPHVLRHTYATLLRQAGIADRVSMDLLGHESLSTLQRYSHVFEHEYAAQVERVSLDLD